MILIISPVTNGTLELKITLNQMKKFWIKPYIIYCSFELNYIILLQFSIRFVFAKLVI